MEIQRIKTDTELYDYMENLLINSFPEEEYRELSDLKEYTDHKPIFFNNIILNEGKPVGFITYWDLDSFYYIEHFAIDPNQRNGGYGQKLLNYLSGILDRPMVLEVELPTTEMAQRRINFYKRQGFELWSNEYFQPPYKIGFTNLPMLIMVKNGLNSDKDFEAVKSKIHKVIYNYE
ncbi:GNAT family N-acetyltransferase [Bacteroides sp. 519]|uniref:GNAT family N-acetyltransferase n=1 Tax=Bacteroides sp. 519 TaxID=2302937 RepID=UPI0013D242DA|nr:GNAT family N-acetyltransferase [Bacteroides sp. 519]NDV58694.1 GNAT family N-acetyltransferase [Bacteroides sp. 519]